MAQAGASQLVCGWSSVVALEAQCYFPRMSLCMAVPQAALWLLWLSRPALLQPVHCSCPELHVRHLGTNRLHSLPQFLVLAAVLAMAFEPACSASLHTRERVCARVCECVSACGTLPHFPTYLLTCVLLLFSFLPSPPNFFFLPDPEFLCQLTARFFCFLLLLETNKT